jgi:formylglycine-generating enzyme
MNTLVSRHCSTILVAVLLACTGLAAHADVFNMGGTRDPATGTWTGLASLEFVTVGDPGNAADSQVMNDSTTGYGSVGYTYRMGTYNVTTAQYCQFLNAVATISDPYGVWNSNMATDYPYYLSVNLGISRSGTAGSYAYSVMGTGNVPVFDVTWGDAARFCNWLQNGQPSAPGTVEGTGTTETGAYTLNGSISDSALILIARNTAVASYFIPTEKEWYKAAYYKGNGTAAGYWTYPTKSNAAPVNILSSTGTNNVNFYDYYHTGNGGCTDPTNYLTTVGRFAGSPGPYGTYDQGGDVWQWNETAVTTSGRGLRGGSYLSDSNSLAASYRNNVNPTDALDNIGFRVASVAVPEPASIALLLAGGVSVLAYARRRRRLAE